MKTIRSLLDIADQAQTFFLDLYGVIFNGEIFFPQGLVVLKQLKEQGKKIALLSNSTVMNPVLMKRYVPLGLIQGVHYDKILSSGSLLKKWLEETDYLDKIAGKDGRIFVVGLDNPELFESVQNRLTTDSDKAAVVYVSSVHMKQKPCLTVDPFIPVLQKLLDRKLPMICANPDYFAFEGPIKYVTPGSLARWYEEHGGRVFWIGKPYADIYRHACQEMNTSPAQSVMVGDTIRTDIKGGQQAGMQTVLITGVGITYDVLQHGTTLQELIKESDAAPTYLLEKIG